MPLGDGLTRSRHLSTSRCTSPHPIFCRRFRGFPILRYHGTPGLLISSICKSRRITSLAVDRYTRAGENIRQRAHAASSSKALPRPAEVVSFAELDWYLEHLPPDCYLSFDIRPTGLIQFLLLSFSLAFLIPHSKYLPPT